MYTMEELAENVDRQCKMIGECQLPAPRRERACLLVISRLQRILTDPH